MKHLKYIVLALTVITFFSAKAQEKQLIKGNEAFNVYAFINAQKQYLNNISEDEKTPELYKQLGDAYYQIADYENAAVWLKEWYTISDKKEKEYVLKYAQALKSTEQYNLSDKILETQEDYLETIEKNSNRFTIENVAFNSELSDFAPSFYGMSVVFSSNRIKRSVAKNSHKWNNQPFLDLYVASFEKMDNTNGGSVEMKKFNTTINTRYHESTAIYTRDLQTVYFTRNNFIKGDYKEDVQGINRLKLYKGIQNEKGNWNVTELPFNSDEYSLAHPALSVDEKILYFSSDKPGGKGKSDIYKVNILAQGFSLPENLGHKINTEGRDTFPFVSADNQLYFSSEGHLGLGGLDVFVSEIKTTGYGDIYNVGRPINSSQDDFTFIINSDTGNGYFASNRENGNGYDDIYSFNQSQPLEITCEQSISGIVTNKKTNEILPNAKVVLVDNKGEILSELVSDTNGVFNFYVVDCESSFTIKASKEGFTTSEAKIVTTKENKARVDAKLVLQAVKKEPVVAAIGTDLFKFLNLKPIYFDYDKSFIRPDAEIELAKIIRYMKEFPNVKVDVRSHTDSRGRDTYNFSLSNRRNKSTKDYVIKIGGISVDRLTGNGYGETELTNNCSNGVKCSKEEHQENRRSEFIVISN